MGAINYDIAAFFLNLMNLYLFRIKSRLFIAQTRFFALLLAISMGATVMDAISVITYQHALSIPLWILYAVNVLFYLFQNTIPLAFTLFILSLGGSLDGMRKITKLLILTPWIVSLCIILSSPITGFAFRFDRDIHYARGPGLPILYAMALVYTIQVVMGIVTDRRKMPQETRLATYLFISFSIVPAIIQYFCPNLLLQCFGFAVSELIVLLTVQDFGRYVDQDKGLFNRDGLLAQLEIVMRKRVPFTVHLVSLDSIDFLRHVLGSEAFSSFEREITANLFGSLTTGHFAARLAPGSYILVDESPNAGEQASRKLSASFQAPWKFEDRQIPVSAHICRIRIPGDTKDIQRVFQAHYHLSGSQSRYPANVILSLEDLSLGDTARALGVMNAIRKALSTANFDVYFQPIVSATSGKVVSAEALVRLHDEELGWISPDEFITISEKNGTIYRIGEYVLERSCAFLAMLRKSGHSLDYIEINLSALQCLQTNLTESILAISRNYGLEPKDLCLEITETATHFSRSVMNKNLESLVSSGFTLAIDDFGTGNSNIGTLMSIPFHTVKLDRSIILAGEKTEEGKIAIEEFTSMFIRMGVQIVAEGIETREQLQSMRKLGIPLIQGYYYAKPLPTRDFFQFLSGREA
jgi:EAL domain-containing protein (putative c-di-GMP-specific phosphodiesterase class I)